MSTSRARRTSAEREALRPHVAEWFGHRVYPTVADHVRARDDQRAERCPFLSQVAEQEMACVKNGNSRGVCTISAGSNGMRQDWLVCPHRALDDDLLHAMVRRLFSLTTHEPVHVLPITNLADDRVRERLVADARNPTAPRQFLTFQQLFGGEISLRRSSNSPELSFDATVVEVEPAEGAAGIQLGRYGVIEMQTTDTHGTYRYAVDALRGALDLHSDGFAAQVAAHPDWPGRRVEGPNISNVFKRTFYQVMFKFQIARRASSSGCILALPRPVWDSWQPFLGAPELVDMSDGTHRLRAQGDDVVGSPTVAVPNWIYIFDVSDEPPPDGSTTPVELQLVIATDALTLNRLALDIAPSNAIGEADAEDTVVEALRRRARTFVPGVQ
ncbi:MAG: hypothetical protein ACRCSN_01780 [Dermatophilaceae bacterium]